MKVKLRGTCSKTGRDPEAACSLAGARKISQNYLWVGRSSRSTPLFHSVRN